MKNNARVLVIDASSENRELLSTLLRRQGAEVLTSPRPSTAPLLTDQISEQENPDLIVLDAESDRSPSPAEVEDLGQAATRSSIPIVVLGTKKKHLTPLETGLFVSKPYHYVDLIRRISELLDRRLEV